MTGAESELRRPKSLALKLMWLRSLLVSHALCSHTLTQQQILRQLFEACMGGAYLKARNFLAAL